MSGIEMLGTVLTIALIVLLAWNYFYFRTQKQFSGTTTRQRLAQRRRRGFTLITFDSFFKARHLQMARKHNSPTKDRIH
jgi:Tfp pilus assembly protein PilW